MTVVREHKCPASVAFDAAGRTRLLYCGQWSCERCSKKLARKWAAIIKYHIKTDETLRSGEEWIGRQGYWFITLTLRGSMTSVTEAFKRLPKLWDGLRKAFYKKYAFWRYLAFVEGQPNREGMPHFHIISDVPIPVWPGKHGIITKRQVHDFAHKAGFGFEAEQSIVTTSKAAAYVAKYTSKGDPAMPRHFRRVRASKYLWRQEEPEREKWLVKARNEGLGDFVSRVSLATGLSEVEVYTRMMVTWAENAESLPPMPRKW